MSRLQPPLRTLIFDFDYTLVDSALGTIDGVNFAFEHLGLPPASADAVRETIGLSLPDILTALAGADAARDVERFTELFFQRADETMVALATFYPDVPETLHRLWEAGFQLGIVSQKHRKYLHPILEGEHLREAFAVIVGGSDAPYKPNPAGLLQAISHTGSTPQSSIYVGDSVTDAETARRADVPFIAVLSGVTPRAAFRDYDVYAVLEGVPEILDLAVVKNVLCP